MERKFVPCIGFAGPAGAGKNTAAVRTGVLLASAGYQVAYMAFAHPIKEMVRTLMQYAHPAEDIDLDYIEAAKREVQTNPIPGVQANMRKLLQTLGTEWGRQCIDEDLWVKVAATRMDDDPSRTYLFTDVRFTNEADMIRQKGGFIIHIEREGAGTQWHLSEQGFPPAPNDVVVPNNGTHEQLTAALEGVLRLKGLIG